jgi:hypothetical protein
LIPCLYCAQPFRSVPITADITPGDIPRKCLQESENPSGSRNFIVELSNDLSGYRNELQPVEAKVALDSGTVRRTLRSTNRSDTFHRSRIEATKDFLSTGKASFYIYPARRQRALTCRCRNKQNDRVHMHHSVLTDRSFFGQRSVTR